MRINDNKRGHKANQTPAISAATLKTPTKLLMFAHTKYGDAAERITVLNSLHLLTKKVNYGKGKQEVEDDLDKDLHKEAS